MTKLISGLALLMFGLWGGAWLQTVFPQGQSYGFAAYMTTLVVMMGGAALIALGILKR